ncbi:hypothetical protein [Dinghuibacter silviterrae]|uniref:Uncharacterized protein n=1 Tax=Dinghuibacter silviterrae TaxID=1539049 RepID=A0A4R8DW49_9BACT|nr:hypothetical protein [Dinghuibacter silviterrae]TDX01441.1 hypothetical protein EDB95_2476 [Dinghuibacter silviterrae]
MNTKPGAALSRSEMMHLKGGAPQYAPCPSEGESCFVNYEGKIFYGTCEPHGGAFCYCIASGAPINQLCANPPA